MNTEHQLDVLKKKFLVSGRGTMDAICQLQISVEICPEMKTNAARLLIDCTKTFVRVRDDTLYDILLKAGVPDTEISTIKNIRANDMDWKWKPRKQQTMFVQ